MFLTPAGHLSRAEMCGDILNRKPFSAILRIVQLFLFAIGLVLCNKNTTWWYLISPFHSIQRFVELETRIVSSFSPEPVALPRKTQHVSQNPDVATA